MSNTLKETDIKDNNTTHIATQQEKLDAIFGITGGKTVDDFLNGLELETSKITETMDDIDSTVKTQIT